MLRGKEPLACTKFKAFWLAGQFRLGIPGNPDRFGPWLGASPAECQPRFGRTTGRTGRKKAWVENTGRESRRGNPDSGIPTRDSYSGSDAGSLGDSCQESCRIDGVDGFLGLDTVVLLTCVQGEGGGERGGETRGPVL
jgi:hypothetical protein